VALGPRARSRGRGGRLVFVVRGEAFDHPADVSVQVGRADEAQHGGAHLVEVVAQESAAPRGDLAAVTRRQVGLDLGGAGAVAGVRRRAVSRARRWSRALHPPRAGGCCRSAGEQEYSRIASTISSL
jgi:hypothetical protein